MMKILVSATASAALCLTTVATGAAAAQEYRSSAFEAPRGVTATLNLRVPLGRDQARRTTYGLTVGYGQTVAPGIDGRTSTRAINLADFRFNGDELRQARVAGLDLANLDRTRRQMNLSGGNDTWWIIGGVVVVVGACLLLECHDEIFGDDAEDVDTTTP